MTLSQVAPSAERPPSGVKKLDTKAPASDFSQILSGQMFKAQRPSLAPPQGADAGLQVLPLGNHMQVITSKAALPDATSLAEFARSQGFDESAIQALFGPK